MANLLDKLRGRDPEKQAQIKAEAEDFARKQGHDPTRLKNQGLNELDFTNLDPLDHTLDREVAGLPPVSMGVMPNPRGLMGKLSNRAGPSILDQRKINQALEAMTPDARALAQKDTSGLLKRLQMTEQAEKAAARAKAEARAANGSKYQGVPQSAENVGYGRTGKGSSDMQDWTTRGGPDVKASLTKRKRPTE